MSKLSIQNIDLYYGDFKALKNINMEIEENKITAFIGPHVLSRRFFCLCLEIFLQWNQQAPH